MEQTPPATPPLPGITIADIKAESEKSIRELKKPDPQSLLITKTANQCMEDAGNQPIPLMLFSEYWFEGEVCFLFAGSNVGKSILAVQIADSISRGTAIPGFTIETTAQPVLYCDFELSGKQFQRRYSRECESNYVFHPNFLRTYINTRGTIPRGLCLEQMIEQEIEQRLIETGAKVLIIDNLTFLRAEKEKGGEATDLMHMLINLRNKYNLSLMVLTHTPKRDQSAQLTMDDMKGSSTLTDLCDSAIALGKSARDKNMRYIKQVKQRSCEETYGEENVGICLLEKPDNFLQLTHIRFDSERAHLKRRSDEETEALHKMVVELYEQGCSFRDIAGKTGMSHTGARKIYERLTNNAA